MATVQETFEAMPRRFRPERAEGVCATIQYEITGEGGGTCHVLIADGTCTLRDGPAASAPSLTVSMTAPDWLDLLAGRLDGQLAFLSGRIMHRGDLGLLMRLPGLFGI